jgi:hypothetical protein
MPIFRVKGVLADTGKSLRARLYLADSATGVADLALTESPAGSGQYSGSASVSSLADGDYEFEVREVSAQSESGFNASTNVRSARADYARFVNNVAYVVGAPQVVNVTVGGGA